MGNTAYAKIIPLPQAKRKKRKIGVNKKKTGSVRKMYGEIYLDFRYLGERVREPMGLPYNEKNKDYAREELDKIIASIKFGSFRFTEVFPHSKKKDKFSEMEMRAFKLKPTPEQVKCGDYFDSWYNVLKDTDHITERTLLGYKSLLNLYLKPFFKNFTFADLNAIVYKKFEKWSKERKYKGKVIANKSFNKNITVLKMVCKAASIEYGWKGYDAFFGYKNLKEKKSKEYVDPFSLEEQQKIIEQLPEFYKTFFEFCFSSGVRAGEIIAIYPQDIDWENKILHIRRAMTKDINGKPVEGNTKNESSRRDIELTNRMYEALKAQQEIYNRFKEKYFFCNSKGKRVHRSNLRLRIWIPTLERAGIRFRNMGQTRHSFASIALSSGENPAWIASVMGHTNSKMLFEVYGKFIKISGKIKGGELMEKDWQSKK